MSACNLQETSPNHLLEILRADFPYKLISYVPQSLIRYQVSTPRLPAHGSCHANVTLKWRLKTNIKLSLDETFLSDDISMKISRRYCPENDIYDDKGYVKFAYDILVTNKSSVTIEDRIVRIMIEGNYATAGT